MFSFRKGKEENLNKSNKEKEENKLDGITKHLKGFTINNLNKTSPIITKMLLNHSNKNSIINENKKELIKEESKYKTIKIKNLKNENKDNYKLHRHTNGMNLLSFNLKSEIDIKTPLEIHNIINNKNRNIIDNEEIVKFLYNLQPFSNRLINTFLNSQEEILRKISYEYNSEIIKGNSIIFRYGDEADKFYIIHKGKVDLLFPYTENVELNKDEYYIYLLRLRRFNEIEMLHNVLLMNQSVYMENFGENFLFDNWITKAYNTLIRLEYDPYFIVRTSVKKKKKKKSMNNDNKDNNISLNNFSSTQNINYDNIKFDEKVFENKKMKELILRISEEIKLTIKASFPDLYKEVKVDKLENKRTIKNIPLNSTVFNSILNNVKSEDYINRIKPPIIETGEKRKKIIIMKYLFIKTINSGEHFGDILNDNLSLFSQEQLSLIKKSPFNYKLHQFPFFRSLTAITQYENDNYIGYIYRKNYYDTLKRFSEKFNNEKNNFLLQNFLFNKVKNPNIIKTYSICFNEMYMKENEILISQNDIINNENKLIYFIRNGEFQSKCYKNIEQIDDLISNFGYGEKLYTTFPKNLIDIIDTPYYDSIIKQKFKMKLGYVTSNDIIGLSENIEKNMYFNDFICTSKLASLYVVNFKIVNFLINCDENINSCKEIILYNKYKILSETLLKQRQIYLSCFFQKENNTLINIKPEKKVVKTKYDNRNYWLKRFDSNEENVNSIISSIGNLEKMFSKINKNYDAKINLYQKRKNNIKKDNNYYVKENKNSQSMNEICDYKMYREKYLLSSKLRRINYNDQINNDNLNSYNDSKIEILYEKDKRLNNSRIRNTTYFDSSKKNNNSLNLFDIKKNKIIKKNKKILIKNQSENKSERISSKNRSLDKILGHGFFKQNDIMTLKLRRMYSSKLDKILFNEYTHNKIVL